MYSNQLSQYYDNLMGDYSSILDCTKTILDTHLPNGSTLLELGCGTGNILKPLSNKYKVSGLDLSSGMLEIVKRRLPNSPLYLADMRSFSLDKKYDAIICIFDSINHLTSFSDWKKTFKRVAKHLRKDGLFVFDMNTLQRLESLSALPTYTKKLNNSTLAAVKIHKSRKNHYGIRFQVFEKIHAPSINYFEETVSEASFDLSLVQKELSKKFHILSLIDPVRERVSDNSGRIFFVCRRI